MCAQFFIRANLRKIAERFEIDLREDAFAAELQHPPDRILPYSKAPVVLQDKAGMRRIEWMQFSLLPSWSKEGRVKFATHNARLEGIETKPTWRKVFAEQRCLVPLTNFIEPIYTGEYAGNMVCFGTGNDEILAAAGLWDEWVNPKDGEIIRSFTIVTHDPMEFVRRIGHDRSPVFLSDAAFAPWLEPMKKNPEVLRKILLTQVASLELTVSKDRPLKSGWEKRA